MTPLKNRFIAALAISALSLTALFVSPLLADDHGRKKGGHHEHMKDHDGKERKGPMKRMDSNQDGKVSRDEFIAAHTKMFNKIDQNQDGFLNQDELHTFHEKRRSHGKDHDGAKH